MFKRLRKLAENAKNLNQKILFRIVFSDTEVQDLILDLNRIEQLFKEGIDENGRIIGEYSEVTEMLTKGQTFGYGGSSGRKTKKAGQPIFLLDEGDFYKSFKVKLLDDGFVIQADALKDDGNDLTEQYGKSILGLTNKSKREIVKEILPMVIQETRKALVG
jgi:hypothetical protein